MDAFAIEKKLDRLIRQYIELKKQNEKLVIDYQNIIKKLDVLENENINLKEKNKLLKLSANLGSSSEIRDEARKEIKKIVREIDKCLVLLNQ
jgi:hypothetical protein